jgi:hypothetical protein
VRLAPRDAEAAHILDEPRRALPPACLTHAEENERTP